MKCPKCGQELQCDMVDIGVGEIQCGPYVCEPCDWVEDSPESVTLDDAFSMSLEDN